MHIPDGFLPASVCAAGYVATAAVAGYSIYKINKQEDPREDIPKAALMTAAFFVVSWIHIPVPPSSVHLILGGLMGAMLGYYAFPAILIGLFFQAVMFQHGGLTTLGVNAIVMGVPALLAYHVFRLKNVGNHSGPAKTGLFGFLAGFGSIAVSVVLFVVVLLTFVPAGLDLSMERTATISLIIAHVPLMFIEGAFTALVVVFLLRVQPRLLGVA